MAVLAVNIGDIVKGAMIMGYEYQEKFVDKANEILANQMKTTKDVYWDCIKTYEEYLRCWNDRPFQCWNCIHKTACKLTSETCDKILSGELEV